MQGSNAAMNTDPLAGLASPAAISATICACVSLSHVYARRSPSPSVSVTGVVIARAPRAYAASRISSSAMLRDDLQARIRALRSSDFVTFSPSAVLFERDDVGSEIEIALTAEKGDRKRIRVDGNSVAFELPDAFGSESAAHDDLHEIGRASCRERV